MGRTDSAAEGRGRGLAAHARAQSQGGCRGKDKDANAGYDQRNSSATDRGKSSTTSERSWSYFFTTAMTSYNSQLSIQIPEDLRQQVISHQRQILEVKTSLHNRLDDYDEESYQKIKLTYISPAKRVVIMPFKLSRMPDLGPFFVHFLRQNNLR